MRTVFISAIAILYLFAATAQGQAPASLPGYKLVWSDEFNGAMAELDRYWNFQNGPSGAGGFS